MFPILLFLSFFASFATCGFQYLSNNVQPLTISPLPTARKGRIAAAELKVVVTQVEYGISAKDSTVHCWYMITIRPTIKIRKANSIYFM